MGASSVECPRKDLPIIFSAPMIRALLEGRKTVTRRLVKPQPRQGLLGNGAPCYDGGNIGGGIGPVYHVWEPKQGHVIPLTEDCRYRWATFCRYQVGDRLWVRERFGYSVKDPERHDEGYSAETHDVAYAATGEDGDWERYDADGSRDRIRPPWRSPIYMPRWASRITLEVVSVGIERVQDITEEDARAEGVRCAPLQEGEPGCWWLGANHNVKGTPRVYRKAARAFGSLWDVINGKHAPWASSPWVWRIEFRRSG